MPKAESPVSQSPMPLDKATLASSSGLHTAQIPNTTTLQRFNSATKLKLGPPPKGERLKEQVVRTLQDADDEAMAANGTRPDQAESGPNGESHDASGPNGMSNGDVEMRQPDPPPEINLEPENEPGIVSPDASETLPPVPTLFRVVDLKREVEAVRDKRRLIRLGPGAPPGKTVPATSVLPSVVAFTLMDGGEGYV